MLLDVLQLLTPPAMLHAVQQTARGAAQVAGETSRVGSQAWQTGEAAMNAAVRYTVT
jgi:hypothetical protein